MSGYSISKCYLNVPHCIQIPKHENRIMYLLWYSKWLALSVSVIFCLKCSISFSLVFGSPGICVWTSVEGRWQQEDWLRAWGRVTREKWLSVSQWMKIVAYCVFLPFKLYVIPPSSLRVTYFIIFLLTTAAVIIFLHRLPIRIECHNGSSTPRAIYFPSASRDSKICASILHCMKLLNSIEFLCLLWPA